MKLTAQLFTATGLALLLATNPLLAGEGKSFKDEVVLKEGRKWGAGSLSTGWDSLYMFRGVSSIRSKQEIIFKKDRGRAGRCQLLK